MSTKYTIKVPDGVDRWGTAMSENITKCIHELAAEIKETITVKVEYYALILVIISQYFVFLTNCQ